VVESTKGDTTIIESVTVATTEHILPRNNMIIINPLKFFLFYNLSYFQKVSQNIGLGGGIQIPTPAGLDGFGLNAEVRFHPSGKTLRGFYLAPNIAYNRLISDDDDEVSSFSIGTLIGWQWFPSKEFAIGLGIGVDYYTGSASNNDDDFGDFSGFVPALRFDIGYAW
jgi:hypothetical protein